MNEIAESGGKQVPNGASSCDTVKENNIGYQQLADTNQTNFDLDKFSRERRFGWATLLEINVPYIIRKNGSEETKYVLLKTAVNFLFLRFLNIFGNNLFDLFPLKMYSMTTAESRLFNDINFQHCDGLYGINPVTENYNILKLDDVEPFINFLDEFHRGGMYKEQTFGYVQFDQNEKESNLISVYKTDDKFLVPQLFFEGDLAILKTEKIDSFSRSVFTVLLLLLKKKKMIKDIPNTPLLVSQLKEVISFIDVGPRITFHKVGTEKCIFSKDDLAKPSVLTVHLCDAADFRKIFPVRSS